MPAFVRNIVSSQGPDVDKTIGTFELSKSDIGVESSHLKHSKTAKRLKKMTDKRMAYQVEIKLAGWNSAFKRLKKQIEKINELRVSSETTIEQLEEARFHLDKLRNEFNDAQKEYDDLLESEEEKEASYRWFDMRDREFIECPIRVCERMQGMETNSHQAPSVKLSHTRRSEASRRSKSSSSSTKHLSLTLVEAASKAAKLQRVVNF